MKQENISKVM